MLLARKGMIYTKRMNTAVAYRHIESVPGILSGEPVIRGTRVPVRSIVLKTRLGYTPEDVVTALPHITVAEVLEALSYYDDNVAEIEAHIERNHIPDELIHPLVRDMT